MGNPTKEQLVRRKESGQWYINFHSAVARTAEFGCSKTVELNFEEKAGLVLHMQKLSLSTRDTHQRGAG